MPYITCPDGKTYSRYDSSKYVKTCIADQKAQQQAQQQACLQDTACAAKMETNKLVVIGFGVAFFLCIVVLMVTVHKALISPADTDHPTKSG